MFTLQNKKKTGLSYLIVYGVVVLCLFIIRPIANAAGAGAFPFSVWFFSFLNTFSSIQLWVFTFAMILSIGYVRKKENQKFDFIFVIIAIYTIVWLLIVAINGIFSTALVAGAVGKARGSAVGARVYDWAGFFEGLFMLLAVAYFFINAKFFTTLKDFFKSFLVFAGHGEKIEASSADFFFGKEIKLNKKAKETASDEEGDLPLSKTNSIEQENETTLDSAQESEETTPVEQESEETTPVEQESETTETSEQESETTIDEFLEEKSVIEVDPEKSE